MLYHLAELNTFRTSRTITAHMRLVNQLSLIASDAISTTRRWRRWLSEPSWSRTGSPIDPQPVVWPLLVWHGYSAQIAFRHAERPVWWRFVWRFLTLGEDYQPLYLSVWQKNSLEWTGAERGPSDIRSIQCCGLYGQTGDSVQSWSFSNGDPLSSHMYVEFGDFGRLVCIVTLHQSYSLRSFVMSWK